MRCICRDARGEAVPARYALVREDLLVSHHSERVQGLDSMRRTSTAGGFTRFLQAGKWMRASVLNQAMAVKPLREMQKMFLNKMRQMRRAADKMATKEKEWKEERSVGGSDQARLSGRAAVSRAGGPYRADLS